jgi:hypothetical protein
MKSMSKTFSQRTGNEDASPLQIDCMSLKLQNRLWNLLYELIKPRIKAIGTDWFEFDNESKSLVEKIIDEHFGLRRSELDPDSRNAWKVINYLENIYKVSTWHGVYSLIEFVLKNLTFDKESFLDKLNEILVSENSGYRISNDIFVPIVSVAELSEITKATIQSCDNVKDHLSKATEFLSPTQKSPNYRNSIKESISAVEALLRNIFDNNQGLSENVTMLKKVIYPSLAIALDKIYGYTSDAPGVRHSHKANANGTEVNTPNQDDAKFSLVVCSAYINLIKAKHDRKK